MGTIITGRKHQHSNESLLECSVLRKIASPPPSTGRRRQAQTRCHVVWLLCKFCSWNKLFLQTVAASGKHSSETCLSSAVIDGGWTSLDRQSTWWPSGLNSDHQTMFTAWRWTENETFSLIDIFLLAIPVWIGLAASPLALLLLSLFFYNSSSLTILNRANLNFSYRSLGLNRFSFEADA